MPRTISPLSHVDPRAELGEDVEIGPFCSIGPDVVLGDRCKLISHVALLGLTRIGSNNQFHPGAVIGGDPQDYSYSGAPTRVEIGDDNIFREGVTVNRAAEKEDHVTVVGNRCFLMANSHVGHNCRVGNNVAFCNGVLLGGHVHVHDFAILSGNVCVHQFASVGTSAFISGGSRVVVDVPPYMLMQGNDDPQIVTINLVGMQRRGISQDAIRVVKRAHKLLFREFKSIAEIKDIFLQELDGVLPIELLTLLNFVELQRLGKSGRGREAIRNRPVAAPADSTQRRAA